MKAIQQFFRAEYSPGILLCVAAILAMIAENSFFRDAYTDFKNLPVIFQFGSFILDKPFILWINDGLMAIFFLFIALEIKRELIEGHLSRKELFILPAIAAVGGLVVPALIYAYINWDYPETISGWAIPAATDIAFALGVLIILGQRVPSALKVLLVAIAIIDDLAAILIIAIFYTEETSLSLLSLGGLGLLVTFLFNRLRLTALTPYLLVGLFIWACILKSGVHATLAGVALGFMIPLKAKNEYGDSPLKVLEHALYPFVSFFIIPIFAFANAGVYLLDLQLSDFLNPVTFGIMIGLLIGKQIGVMGSTYVAIRLGICSLPAGVTWYHYYGMSLLTGIGFTMSLFVGALEFADLEYLSAVRLGVLSGSLLSGGLGVIVLLIVSRNKKLHYD